MAHQPRGNVGGPHNAAPAHDHRREPISHSQRSLLSLPGINLNPEEDTGLPSGRWIAFAAKVGRLVGTGSELVTLHSVV